MKFFLSPVVVLDIPSTMDTSLRQPVGIWNSWGIWSWLRPCGQTGEYTYIRQNGRWKKIDIPDVLSGMIELRGELVRAYQWVMADALVNFERPDVILRLLGVEQDGCCQWYLMVPDINSFWED